MPCPVGRRITSTPISPSAMAVQRRGPTVSRSSGPAMAVTSSGATKVIAYAVDSGMVRRP